MASISACHTTLTLRATFCYSKLEPEARSVKNSHVQCHNRGHSWKTGRWLNRLGSFRIHQGTGLLPFPITRSNFPQTRSNFLETCSIFPETRSNFPETCSNRAADWSGAGLRRSTGCKSSASGGAEMSGWFSESDEVEDPRNKDALAWLKLHHPFSEMDAEALNLILQAKQVKTLQPGEQLSSRAAAGAVILVRRGEVAATRSVAGLSSTAPEGTALGWEDALLAHPPAAETGGRIIGGGQTAAELWLIPTPLIRSALLASPDAGVAVAEGLAGRVEALEADEGRARILRPYLVPCVKRGVIGRSRFAQRTRKEIIRAAQDPQRSPVFVFGERGLDKVNCGALIHFGSRSRLQPMVTVDCARVDRNGVEIFGGGEKKGLLQCLGPGSSLMLTNVHLAPPTLLPAIVTLVAFRTFRRVPVPGSGAAAPGGRESSGGKEAGPPLQSTGARIVLTSEKRVPELEKFCTVITVPALRVRPADIADMARYYWRQLAGRWGQGEQPSLSLDAVRHLETYHFPGNMVELEAMMERGASQADAVRGQVPAGVFWFAPQQRDRGRIDLLQTWPELKAAVRSPWWPDALNFRVIAPAFAVFVGLCLLGPQDREHSPALLAFWAYWWPGVFLAYPVLGRIWCSVCPFMIYGELVQTWRLSTGAELLKWPRETAEKYGPWFLFSLFTAILVWEEVWDLPQHAALSGSLLLLITAGAVLCSAVFERRLWCRFLCPIGGMNGLFAKLAVTELRGRQGVCAGSCSSYHCFKGGPAEPPEGLETPGCPLYSHPAQLQDNKDCVLCMKCVKACPHSSIQLRLRPPAADLWSGHKGSWGEVCVLFLLLGAVYVHRIPELGSHLGLPAPFLHGVTTPHVLLSAALLLLPLPLAAAASAVSDRRAHALGQAPARPFVEVAYAYVPLVWALTLAHYLDVLLREGGTILPVTARSVGQDWLADSLPYYVAPDAVVSLLQGSLLLVGASSSLVLLRRIGAQPWSTLAPSCAAIATFTAAAWALVVAS